MSKSFVLNSRSINPDIKNKIINYSKRNFVAYVLGK